MQIYLVGGAVRDRLLGLEAKDRDYVVTGAVPADLIALGYKQVGRGFPVFLHPQTHEEYALARTEKKNGSGYTGFICDFGPEITLQEDLKRRDLTINAMALDSSGKLIDPWGGFADLQARVLRHVSPAFCEDPLRVLRAARFAAKLAPLGFKLHPDTQNLMTKMARSGELTALTAERCLLELEKALSCPDSAVFFTLLHKCGALSQVLPEFEELFTTPALPEAPAYKSAMDLCSSVLQADTRAARLQERSLNTEARFGICCLQFSTLQAQSLNARLPLTREYSDSMDLCRLYAKEMLHFDSLNAQETEELFCALDLYRRPARCAPFLQAAGALAAAVGLDAEKLCSRFLQLLMLAQGVQARTFASAGLKGKAVGEAVKAARIALFKENGKG